MVEVREQILYLQHICINFHHNNNNNNNNNNILCLESNGLFLNWFIEKYSKCKKIALEPRCVCQNVGNNHCCVKFLNIAVGILLTHSVQVLFTIKKPLIKVHLFNNWWPEGKTKGLISFTG